jgi:AsmA protein
MNKAIKWVSIVVGGLIVLVILVVVITPMFVDIQKYKPEIESKVSEATGRPFTLGGDLDLSLFPWVGVSLADLHLGNPEGFEGKDLLSVKSFEVRVKVLPLLSKNIEVKRFVVESPRITLERRKDGKANWEGIGQTSDKDPGKASKEVAKPKEDGPKGGLPIKGLAVNEFAITDGLITYIDHTKGDSRKISDLNLRLQEVSLENPIKLSLSANLDDKPISLEGKVGPVGKDPGKGTIPLDLALKALKELDISVKGKIVDATSRQQFDMALQVSPFSPRKLFKELGQDFPVKTTDPKALNKVALKVNLAGGPKNVTVSNGALDLDESKLTFSLKAKDFNKPDLAFDLKLDKIDLDRYMPPPSEKKEGDGEKKATDGKQTAKKTNYKPLRKMILDGAILVGQLKAKDVKVQDLTLKVTGKNGIFNLNPLALKLYEGQMAVKGSFDVRKDVPRTKVTLDASGIQSGPFLKDYLKKEILEGTLKSQVAISMVGDEPERIKRTLNGKGDLRFNDGAIVGVDLAGMVRNVAATFGMGDKEAKKPRTDFAELHTPFTITNGLVKTSKTSLKSPLLRVLATGNANLVSEAIDFRVEPKFVGTIKGQGDTASRSGVTVPVLVTGSFSSPKFSPDLKGMLTKGLEEGSIPDTSELLKGQGSTEGATKDIKKQAEGLMKSLPFGK